MGVTVAVLEERAYEDGELVEVALDLFAQHRDGSVHYFGEHVDNFEDGKLRDHAGQWFAGQGGNLPGVIMPATPVLGQTYQQEFAPGIAEDMATVVALNETVVTPVGTFTDCMKTREFTPLEPGLVEFKWHCPGVGLTQEEGPGFLTKLISFVPASPQAALSQTPNRGGVFAGPGAAAENIADAQQPSTSQQPATTTTVQPPRTGDGGLADRLTDEELWLAAVAVCLALAVPTTVRLLQRRQEVK
jgi:hypothetical protein